MQLQTDTAKVRVSGTITGFGSLFRSAALAIGLSDVVAARAIAGPTRLTLTGEATEDSSIEGLPADEHPTVVALHSLLDTVGASHVGLHLQYRGRVPVRAGLGTETIQTLAGLLLGRQLLGDPESLTDSLLESIAGRLGADRLRIRAVMGGPLVVGLPGALEAAHDSFAAGEPLEFLNPSPERPKSDAPAYEIFWQGSVSAPVAPSAFIPSVRSTGRRSDPKLPNVAHFVDAAKTAARSGLLLAVLVGGAEQAEGNNLQQLLLAATRDDLRRKEAESRFPASFALVEWLRSLDIPAFISGNGPAVVTLLPLPQEVISAAERSGWRYFDMGVAEQVL